MRKRRGFPLLPTLLVAFAVPTMIGFGVWQLQRMSWKADLLEQLDRNAGAPVADLGEGPIPAGFQFRTVRLEVDCADGPAPTARAGQNLNGTVGYSHFLACRLGDGAIALNVGWSGRADGWSGPTAGWPSGPVEGVVVDADPLAPPYQSHILVLKQAAPPLEPSAPPGLDTISNNHLSYAIQWFSFAAILAVIYGLWLRRWLATRGTPA